MVVYFSCSALSSLVRNSPLQSQTSIELLRLHHRKEQGQTSVEKHETVSDDILNWTSDSNHRSDSGVDIQILFLSSDREDGCTTNRLWITASTLEKISTEFNISFAFWEAVLVPSKWSKQSGASFHRYNNDELIFIEGFYHYFNEWDKGPLHVWFKYNVRTGHITYILVDCPEEVKKIVIKNAGDQYGCFLHQPLAIDVLIAEQCASWREDLINKRYKQIFVWHENKGTMDMNPPLKIEVLDKSSLQELHQLSRSWNMIYEDLGDLEERLDVLIETASKLEAANVKNIQSAVESLKFIRGRNHLRRRWVTSFGERTKLIIGFVFGIASQKDNETNLKIAHSTSMIADETRRDNSAMITIATMTMLFLPGTFVAAIFSMPFFNYRTDSNGNQFFEVSSHWWLYPTITIPCTLLVVLAYQIWRRNREFRKISKPSQIPLEDLENVSEQVSL